VESTKDSSIEQFRTETSGILRDEVAKLALRQAFFEVEPGFDKSISMVEIDQHMRLRAKEQKTKVLSSPTKRVDIKAA